MAIQSRRGNEVDLDKNKLLPGETATVLDNKKIFHAFGPGSVEQMATIEEMQTAIEEVTEDIRENFTAEVDSAALYATSQGDYAKSQGDYANAKGQQSQAIVDSATPIINTNLQATYSDKATLTGSSVQFTTADDALIALAVKMKSLQTVTTQGKQLFDKSKATAVKYINPTSGVLTTSTYNNNVSALIAVSAGQSVTISGHTFVQPNTPVGLAWYGPTGTYISGTSYQNATGNGTYTAPAGAAYVRYTCNNADLNTSQLEAGSSATSYAAFVPNSPNPDYQAPITSTGDGGSFIAGTSGKNKWPKFTSTTISGITIAVSDDGTITLNGTATANITYGAVFPSYLSSGTYTLSANNPQLQSGGNVQMKLSINTGGAIYQSVQIALSVVNKSQTFTVTSGIPSYAHVYIASGAVLNNFIIQPQLELGTTATPYEAYKGNTVTVNSGGGDLPDGTADIVDLPTKKKTQNKTKTVFSGAAGESWSVYTGDTSVTFTNTIAFKISLLPPGSGWWKANKFRNTHFRISDATVNPYSMDVECFAVDSTGYLIVRLNKVRLATQDIAGFKGYIATVPFTVEYPLITPVTTDITVTPTNYLTSYKGITNVYTTDATQPTLTAVAKSELWARDYLQDVALADIKDSTVTFTDASADATITSGSKISVIIGLIKYKLTNLLTSIGTLSSLTTTVKTSLVSAINELVSGKIDKTSIATTDTVNDTSKVLGSNVGYALGLEIDDLKGTGTNFASVITTGLVAGAVYSSTIYVPKANMHTINIAGISITGIRVLDPSEYSGKITVVRYANSFQFYTIDSTLTNTLVSKMIDISFTVS